MSADRGAGAPSPCPGDDTVALFVGGALASADDEQMRAHIDVCAQCRMLVADAGRLAPSGAGSTTPDSDAPPTRNAQEEHILGPGAVIGGKFQVVRVLGAGGMGKVLAAKHLELGHMVAIKVMHPALASDADAVKRFLREGRAAALIKSDHAVRIHDVGRLPSGVPFLVMEHLVGEDLDALGRRRALTVAEVVDYLLQAIPAIAEAHAGGLVHRDIKPQNLFLARLPDGTSRVKVLDFGLAKELTTTVSADSIVTLEHMVLGSPHYMSPEQIRMPGRVDARADVWGLGATMFKLLTGRPPYASTSVHGLLARILSDPPPKVRELREDVPRLLETIIERCMEKDRERRFGSVQELATALGLAAGGAPETERPAPALRRSTMTDDVPTLVDTSPSDMNATLPMVPQPPIAPQPFVQPSSMMTPSPVTAVLPVAAAARRKRIPSAWRAAFLLVTAAATIVVALSIRSRRSPPPSTEPGPIVGAAPSTLPVATVATVATVAPVVPTASARPAPPIPSETISPPPRSTPSTTPFATGPPHRRPMKPAASATTDPYSWDKK